MKTDHPSIQMDEIEDLTLFAGESFDTDDVDLFEFTEEQDSPLTSLKAIILSLDWEINDNILQELSDEIDHLQNIWQEDKVAQVYLQGLAKVGSYLKKEGAYAHPNAIKLLLTFFYDFEKIISSNDISGDSISALLKADIRKFKILQYQIDQQARQATDLPGREVDAQEEMGDNLDLAETQPITFLKKAVLELEWEINDSTLKQFNTRLAGIEPQFKGDESALIIIQGLQVLGRYIDDERANAHPDATNLIHTFFDGLELLNQENIDEEERKNILIDRVDRLNKLKMLLAPQEQQEQPNSEHISSDKLTFPLPTEKESDPDFSDEILDPAAIQPVYDDITDKLIDEKLHTTATGLTNISDSNKEDEVYGVEEELELFFTSDEEKELPDRHDKNKQEDDFDIMPADDEPATTINNESPLEIDEQLDAFFEVDDNGSEEGGQKLGRQAEEGEILTDTTPETVLSALADSEEDGGFNEEKSGSAISGEPLLEIDDKLDSFFGADDNDTKKEEQQTEAELFSNLESTAVAPALSDTGEQSGFDEEPNPEINDKLDAFFGKDDNDIEEEQQETEQQTGEDKFFADLESTTVVPALSDTGEQSGFDEETVVSTINKEPNPEINDKLNAFFGEDDKKEDIREAETSVETNLAANLVCLSATPSLEIIKQSRETVHKLLDSPDQSTEKTALLQLIDSTLALLPEKTDHLTGDTTELLDFLQNSIEQESFDPKVIAVAVTRFTSWHKNIIEELFLSQAQIAEKQTEATPDLHQELKELKAIMSEEIGALRQEIRLSEDRRQKTEDRGQYS